MEVKILGYAWYREEDYAELKNLFIDGHNLPDTFDEWLNKSQSLFDQLRANGNIVEKVYIELDSFPVWCRSRGLDIDSRSRIDFVNDFVARKYIKKDG
jgi:hypothetical protein